MRQLALRSPSHQKSIGIRRIQQATVFPATSSRMKRYFKVGAGGPIQGGESSRVPRRPGTVDMEMRLMAADTALQDDSGSGKHVKLCRAFYSIWPLQIEQVKTLFSYLLSIVGTNSTEHKCISTL